MSCGITRSVSPDPIAKIYQAVLDRLRLGIALIDSQGRIFNLNRAAQRLTAELEGPGVDAVAHACAGPSAQANALRVWIADALAADEARQPECMRLIPRSGGRAPLSVLAARLPSAHVDLFSMAAPGVAGMLFISAPEAMTAEAEKGLEALYGISGMEARLAASLASGKRIGDITRERGVSINTVKTQLRRLLAKTGARSQAELLRLVLTNVVAWCEQGQVADARRSVDG